MVRNWENYEAVQRFPLLRDYIKVSGNVSYYNEMAGLLSFFYAQGQTLVDYVRIPVGGSHQDPRIHLFWIQPTRSGKTIAWEHTGTIIEDIGIEIANFTTGSDAALIGSWNKTNAGTEDEQLDLVPGLLAGKKCLNFDEGSILFDTKSKHLQEVILYLQQAMNPVGTRANVLTKHLKDGEIKTESRVSFWLTTFPPDGVREVVLGKGVFQRVLLLIRPWTVEQREEVSERRMNTAFTRPPEYEHGVEDFRDYYRSLRKACRDRVLLLGDRSLSEWGNLDIDAREDLVQEIMYDFWEASVDYRPLLNAHKDHMYELVRMMDDKMMQVCAAFIPNLLNYTLIFSTHLALLDQYTQHGEIKEWAVTGDHLEMAAEIVYDLYEDLVMWLESEIELTQTTEARKTREGAWKKAYAKCKLVSVEDKDGDWVRKSELLTTYAKQNGGISRNTQFLHFKNARTLFIEHSVGVAKFVQSAKQWVD
tara:strand:- start:7683 stop:9110 length:1428 start_codon:yes stop_codon:yes gene_type:complete